MSFGGGYSGGGGGAWGSITGTLSSQSDLQTALDAKASLSGAVFTGLVDLNGVKAGTVSSYSGVWINQASPDLTNYSILRDPSNGIILNAQASRNIYLRVANVNYLTVENGGIIHCNGVKLGPVSGYTGIWFNQTTPDLTNYSFLNDTAAGIVLNAPASQNIYFRIANNTQAILNLSGQLGVGLTTSVSAKLHVRSTTEQLRLDYDAANFFSTTVGSSGDVTFGLKATTSKFIFNGQISSPGTGGDSEKFGNAAVASGANCTAVGRGATATTNASTAIGASSSATGNTSVAIGQNTVVSASAATGINLATAAGYGSFAVGDSAYAGDYSIASGLNSRAELRGVAIGYQSNSSASVYSVAIGWNATATASYQFVSGSDDSPVNNLFFGSGVVSASPVSYTINGTGGSGTDIAGGDLNLAAGRPTGAGTGGVLRFKTAAAGSSGTTLQSLADRMTINGQGHFFFANRVSVPGTPSGGGVFYVESGALKYIGSSGTITTIAPA